MTRARHMEGSKSLQGPGAQRECSAPLPRVYRQPVSQVPVVQARKGEGYVGHSHKSVQRQAKGGRGGEHIQNSHDNRYMCIVDTILIPESAARIAESYLTPVS